MNPVRPRRKGEPIAAWNGQGSNLTIGLGGANGAIYNFLWLQSGIWTNFGALTVGSGGGYNSLLATNLTAFSGRGAITVGSGAIGNTGLVQATTAVWNGGGNNLTVGSGSGASGNYLALSGGYWTNFGAVQLGFGTSATNNSLLLRDGALLEANTLTNGVAGNTISNVASIFQFSTNNPSITPRGFGNFAITDGTISFRDVTTGLDLIHNWTGSQLTNISFSGNNALRLNNSTATNTLAGGYTFNTGLGATNYTRLELINGTTAVTGNGITIGTGGSLLASNTTATLSGAFTNYSPNARLVGSTVDFAGGLYSTGKLTLVNSAVVQGAGTKTIDTNGRLEGDGSVVGDITVNGTVAPGLSPGTLTFSNALTLAGAAEFQLYTDVNGGAGVSDQIVIGPDGSIDISGATLVLTLDQSAHAVTNRTQFLLIDNQGTGDITGTFAGYGQGAEPTIGGVQYKFDYFAGTGNDLVLTVIPEPNALTLVGLGLLGAVILRRLGRRQS